jgi:tRNA modification GTPase
MSLDTIFALSSGHLPSGVAVVRVSGAGVRDLLMRIADGTPRARQLVLRNILGVDGSILDRGLVAFFPGPSSFTGEDCCEFHVHGGRASVSAILSSLGAIAGLRMADAGEFTRRAFLNGKMDLTQAEALADLLAAETESQRRLALTQSSGAQRRVYEEWRDRIVFARAMIEAEFDFSDEADVPGSISDLVWSGMRSLTLAIGEVLQQTRAAEIVRDGLDVVILGAPNAGKSSLMNALIGREVAIASAIPGTTRDLIEARLDLNGYRVNVVDTAGVRDDPDEIEGIGIEKALSRVNSADAVLLVEDMSQPGSAPVVTARARVLRVGLKSDLAESFSDYDICVSAVSGDGLKDLCLRIEEIARQLAASVSDATPSGMRQSQELEGCRSALLRALAMVGMPLELRAEELRIAGDRLSRLVGRIGVEDLLDVIFSKFCVGK